VKEWQNGGQWVVLERVEASFYLDFLILFYQEKRIIRKEFKKTV